MPGNDISATRKSFATARGVTECDVNTHNSQPQPASTGIRVCEHKGALPSFDIVAAPNLVVPRAQNVRRVSPLACDGKLMRRLEDEFAVTPKRSVGLQPGYVGTANKDLLRRGCDGDPCHLRDP